MELDDALLSSNSSTQLAKESVFFLKPILWHTVSSADVSMALTVVEKIRIATIDNQQSSILIVFFIGILTSSPVALNTSIDTCAANNLRTTG